MMDKDQQGTEGKMMKRAAAGIAAMVLAALVGLVPRGALGQCCGDCNGDGAITIDEILKAVSHALTSCSDDGVCDASVATCTAQLGECQGDLASCRSQSDCRAFPASGQTTSNGPGSDGDVRAGAALSYTDNGDGTITDNNTGLMWEKKDDSGGIHGMNNGYTWGMSDPPYMMNGTMVTTLLSALNAGAGFAGHRDWRIPDVKELQSIVDYEIAHPGPTVNAAFHNAAGCPGCTDVTLASCSCTASDFYWSSTTIRGTPGGAWVVPFNFGGVGYGDKSFSGAVRAVRSGL
jgi:hypothetical protein